MNDGEMRAKTEAPALPDGAEDTPVYSITASLCLRCGLCAEGCPAGCIARKGADYVIDPRRCTGCGTCAALCPVDAARSLDLY